VRTPPFRRRPGNRRRARRVIVAAVVSCVAVVGAASAAVAGFAFDPFGNQQVSQTYANGILLPTNQWISPLGTRILDNDGTGGTGQVGARLVSSTISPDGQYLAALGWNDFQGFLTIIDLKTGTIVQQTALNTDDGNDPTVAADGPLFSPDGKTLWVPQSEYLLKFSFTEGSATPAIQEDAIFLCGSSANLAPPNADPAASTFCSGYDDAGEAGENPTDASDVANGAELPSGIALSPDGSKLYVALNGANKLGVIDTANDTVLNEIPVGNAPRQVVLADNGTVAYVSNEGGRAARPGDFTNLSDGTPIVSSHVTGGAVTGTVSVVNLTTGKETQEIPVGLEPTALYQDRNALFVANSNDDSLSVVDERTNSVTQTVRTNPVPGAQVGSYANAINMSDPDHVLVSIGRDNAIAVYRYNGLYRPMRLVGLLPTDWYPVQVQPDPALGANAIVVTNDKGIGAQGPESTINKGPDTAPGAESVTGHNTYDDTGSVTTFPMPGDGQLGQDTQTVFTDDDWDQIKPINQGDYDTVPRVIPAHLGGSSPIKHVVVIVRENRTYDQELGDLGEGNGDPADAQFGAQVTPNAHALAERFGDLDNFYDEGTLSADGHNWIVQAEATDYVEKEFGAFYRSYPSQGGDALAYQRDGFLWNAAEMAGLSVQNFGEYIYNPYSLPYSAPNNGPTLDWDQWYLESQWLEDGHQGAEPIPDPCQYAYAQSDIPSLQAITDRCFPNFQLAIPDQYRVDQWLPLFKQQEQSGHMPNLTFMWLMTDHTGTTGVAHPSGVSATSLEPDPVAQAADNDLAVGRVVDAISNSKFWKSTAIFIVEDDTQNGVDHVDGHRGPAFVISPYSATGVDDDYYTQLNMVRTIEQILGIQPMNQEDLAAEPMYSAFTDHPNFTPYTLQQNQIPLTLGAPGYPSTLTSAPAGSTPAERQAFRPQGVVPADMKSVYGAWEAWIEQQAAQHHFDGPDKVNPELMNRFDWYSAHNWQVAYPGDPKIYTPGEVPGRNLPAAFLGDD
jgi:YVTN family beta-propeller protein